MKILRLKGKFKPVLILLLCLVWSKQALAHDPGLSTANVRLDQDGARVAVELAIAPSDIERICVIDSNGDKQISIAEFEAAKTRLLEQVVNGVELWSDDKQLSVINSEASYDSQSSVVVLHLSYSGGVGNRLRLKSRIIHSMARGHKQFVSLKEQDDQILVERMLEASDDELVYDLGGHGSARGSFSGFLRLGVQHILTGYDHLAFLFALLLAGSSFRSAGKVISSFTVAHSITLALATFGLVQIPSRVVEPLIAASIVYVGMENLFRRKRSGRWLLTFGFGLVHGLGFASVLRELGVGQTAGAALMPLLSFNLGVELGQLGVAVLVLPVIWQLKKRPEFDLRYVPACSFPIVVVGSYWLIQRIVV